MPARMFPEILPPDIRNHPLRMAEVRVFDLLAHQLSSRYAVFYSRPWRGSNPDGSEREGEADFVVASRETGYLVLEVKGGGVGRDGTTGQWTSRDRHGVLHRIKDPVKQASGSKHWILGKLRERWSGPAPWLGAAIGVVLPDCTGADALVGLDTPPEKFALSEDMPRLGQWVIRQLDATVSEGRGALGHEGMELLERMLAGAFQLRVPLNVEVGASRERIVLATQQQYAIIEALTEHRELAIAGTAGSGKTLLARMEAIRLAEKHPDQTILLTCFNNPLGHWLHETTQEWPNIVAHSFHKVATDAIHAGGRELPEGTASDRFDRELAEGLIGVVADGRYEAFGAIIIDEGQDFRENWIDALRLCLRGDGPRRFRIFYDSNQRLYQRQLAFLDDMPAAPVRLTRNVRNPRQIFERLRPYLPEGTAVCAGPEGRTVEEIIVPHGSALKRVLDRAITHLVEDEQVRPKDIAVLLPSKDWESRALLNQRFSTGRTCTAETLSSSLICVDTVRRFKGLERPVIIVVEPSELEQFAEELICVALSRPTGHLILVGSRMPSSRYQG